MVQLTAPPKLQEHPINYGKKEPTQQFTVSQYLLGQLQEWGVQRIYGVIGDSILDVLDELTKQNSIQYIACRHESSAALMASAQAKLNGGIGVCMATSGPGIANLFNGLADASLDRTGVLAITGQSPTDQIGTHAKQYIDQQQLMRTITDQTELLVQSNALPEMINTMLDNAKTHGKVAHLSVPMDVWKQQVKASIYPYPKHLHQPIPAPEEMLNEAAEWLVSAEKPVFLLGRGVKACVPEVRQLAEEMNAAVITTMPARSLFDNDHPLYAGGLGQAGSEASSILLAESDLVVVMGATWWPEDYVPAMKPIIQIDISSGNIGLGLGGAVKLGIVADLQEVVPKLLVRVANTREIRPTWRQRVDQVTREWKLRIERETQSDGTPIPPQRVIHTIAETIAADAVVTVDTGDHTLWFNRIFQARKQEILISGRWRTLGFALPAAIAAQLEYPERQVIAIAGDGGAVQTIMEFQTAVQYGCPIVLIILNNGAYAMEKNRMEATGLNALGSNLQNPDFAAIAGACGGVGMRAENAAELERSLREALDMRRPTIIDVHTASTIVPHTHA